MTVGGPIGVRFLGFPRLQAGAESCLDWGSSLAGRTNAKDVPLLIRALAVRRLGVSDQAQRTLVKLAGRDLGPEPGPWLEWWAAECRTRGLAEPRPPKSKPAAGAPAATVAPGHGWQVVLTVIFIVTGLFLLFMSLAFPKQLALPAWVLALIVILAVPRILDAWRARRRRTSGQHGYCRTERRGP